MCELECKLKSIAHGCLRWFCVGLVKELFGAGEQCVKRGRSDGGLCGLMIQSGDPCSQQCNSVEVHFAGTDMGHATCGGRGDAVEQSAVLWLTWGDDAGVGDSEAAFGGSCIEESGLDIGIMAAHGDGGTGSGILLVAVCAVDMQPGAGALCEWGGGIASEWLSDAGFGGDGLSLGILSCGVAFADKLQPGGIRAGGGVMKLFGCEGERRFGPEVVALKAFGAAVNSPGATGLVGERDFEAGGGCEFCIGLFGVPDP